MTAGERAAWLGVSLGAVVLVTVAGLLQRTLRPVEEIERYARHVEAGIDGIAGNTSGVEALAQTRELAVAVPELAGEYLRRMGVV